MSKLVRSAAVGLVATACDLGAKFAVVEAGALVWNALVFYVLVTWTNIPYPAVPAVGLVGSAVVYFGWSFPLWGRVFCAEER
jgi:hypothetical protein